MKIAFVGCGYVFDIYMRTKWAHPELEVCGVFDIDTARANTVGEHFGFHVYPDYETLLADPAWRSSSTSPTSGRITKSRSARWRRASTSIQKSR